MKKKFSLAHATFLLTNTRFEDFHVALEQLLESGKEAFVEENWQKTVLVKTFGQAAIIVNLIHLKQKGKSEAVRQGAEEIFRSINPLYSTEALGSRVRDKEGWAKFAATASKMDLAKERILSLFHSIETYHLSDFPVNAKDISIIIGEEVDLVQRAVDELVKAKALRGPGPYLGYWLPF